LDDYVSHEVVERTLRQWMDGIDGARLSTDSAAKNALRQFIVAAVQSDDVNFPDLDQHTISTHIPLAARVVENLDFVNLGK
jgi:hypothetical protein